MNVMSKLLVAAAVAVGLFHSMPALAGDGPLCGVLQIPYNLWTLRPSNQPAGTYRNTCNASRSQQLFPTVTDLNNGMVLITGGQTGTSYHSGEAYEYDPSDAAELYDVVASRFASPSLVFHMKYRRGTHAAIQLSDRKVLIVGGRNEDAARNAELYNPKTLQFEAAGTPIAARYARDSNYDLESGLEFSATLLADGRVLIAGAPGGPGPTAELYDPKTNAFAAANPMVFARYGGAGVRLPNGKVLIVGGLSTTAPPHGDYSPLDLAELYDPGSGTFSYVGTMTRPRARPTATLLPNGKILIASDTSAELYDPISNVFAATGPVASAAGPAVLLPSGKVLFPAASQMYDPVRNAFSPVASLLPSSAGGPLRGVAATLLGNGQVLVVGGGPDGDMDDATGVKGQLFQP